MKFERKQMSRAMIISMLFLLVGAVLVKAAPFGQEEAPRVSLVTAIAVGVAYYISLSPFLGNLGFTIFYRPLMAGTVVGLIMGQLGRGIAIGANINILYLGWISAGGSLPGDPGLAGYLGTALALGGGLDTQAALAVAAPLGLLGGLTWSLRMSTCSLIPHWADQRAAEADIAGVARSNVIYSQPFLFFVYAVPVTLAAYLGSAAVAQALGWIGGNAGWVMSGLFAASGMLAALGIGLNLVFLFRGNEWPYYFVGFIVASFIEGEVNLLMLAIIGAALAYVHILFTTGFTSETEGAAEEREAPGLLTKRDVFNSWIRWLFFSHAAYNWERLQGLGFAHAMTPIIEKLYKTKEEIRKALLRHLVFFNTQPDIGGIILGATVAMEEERAAGAPISGDAINGVKTGLMGPMAGIGDTVQQGIVIPIALAIAMNIATGGDVTGATRGNILGPLFFLAVGIAFAWGVGWFLYWQGYKQGRSAVANILRSGTLNRFIQGAGVLGNFIIGVLTVSFVSISTPVALTIGGSVFEVQDILNSFMPNLLPLVLVMLIWWLLSKKDVRPTWIMLAIIVIAIVGAYPIWPGINPETGEAIRVGLFG
ncbi:MAG: PTS system mannose/fructose/sorbose family transporter subunit IID [Anaerolineales bacterium]